MYAAGTAYYIFLPYFSFIANIINFYFFNQHYPEKIHFRSFYFCLYTSILNFDFQTPIWWQLAEHLHLHFKVFSFWYIIGVSKKYIQGNAEKGCSGVSKRIGTHSGYNTVLKIPSFNLATFFIHLRGYGLD